MTARFIQLSVKTDRPVNELVVAFLSDVGAEGFIEEGNALSCYIAEGKWRPVYETQVREFLSHLRSESLISDFSVELSEVMNRDWNSAWEESIVPLEVTSRIAIKPSWKEYHGSASIVLEIDPKMSFGTGHHETTRMMIRLIEKYVKAGQLVLDVGTGTGVLAIAAARLGAASCVAVDNDEWSIENARENVGRNAVADKIKIIFGEVGEVPGRDFDLVACNLNRNTLIYIKSEIAGKCKSGGILLLSGILVVDEKSIMDEFSKIGYNRVETLHDGEWSALALKR